MRTLLRRSIALASVLVVIGLLPATALAHPLGNFTTNHYSRIELSPGQVRIFYVLDLAEIPTFQAMQSVIDTDGDEKMSQAEVDAYSRSRASELASNLVLAVNGRSIALAMLSPGGELVPGQGDLPTLRLTFQLQGELPSEMTELKETGVQFIDNNEPDRVGWREIVVRGIGGVTINAANVSDQDVSNELRQYPTDMLQAPLKQTRADFRISLKGVSQSGTVPTGAVATTAFGAASSDAQFAALITQQELTPSVIALALLTAVVLGAVHALEPGHGKSVAAAYLVGARATPWHAVLLGLTITITHTFSVYLMGFITLFASSYILPEQLLPWLGLISGIIIIVMGINMIVMQLRARSADQDHADHSHEVVTASGGIHTHGGKAHSHAAPSGRLGVRNVLAVGISGGLVPCPAGIIVMLSAIGLGRLGFGLVLIVAFSLGLALVLTAVGLAVLYGRKWLSQRADPRIAQRLPAVGRVLSRASAFSGLLVVGAGVLLLYHALPFLRILWN